MGEDFPLIDHRVGGRGEHYAIESPRFRAPGQGNGVLRADGGGGADHRHAAGGYIDGDGEDAKPLVGVEGPGLTGVPGDDEAVDPCGEEQLQVLREAVLVERAIFGKGCDHRAEVAAPVDAGSVQRECSLRHAIVDCRQSILENIIIAAGERQPARDRGTPHCVRLTGGRCVRQGTGDTDRG